MTNRSSPLPTPHNAGVDCKTATTTLASVFWLVTCCFVIAYGIAQRVDKGDASKLTYSALGLLGIIFPFVLAFNQIQSYDNSSSSTSTIFTTAADSSDASTKDKESKHTDSEGPEIPKLT